MAAKHGHYPAPSLSFQRILLCGSAFQVAIRFPALWKKYVSKAKKLREDRRVCPSGAGALERRGRCCHGQPAAGGVSGYAGYFFISERSSCKVKPSGRIAGSAPAERGRWGGSENARHDCFRHEYCAYLSYFIVSYHCRMTF